MDESGQHPVHMKLPCELPAILQLLVPDKDRIATSALESTCNWSELGNGLQDHGYHVVLANPAELLRLNLLRTGHIHDRQTRPGRDRLRRRLLLVRQRIRLILRACLKISPRSAPVPGRSNVSLPSSIDQSTPAVGPTPRRPRRAHSGADGARRPCELPDRL